MLALVFLKFKPSEKKVVPQTYDQAPKLNWTFGVDYDSLVPINTLTNEDEELGLFLIRIDSIFEHKDWTKIIQISNPEHYAEQGAFLGNDTAYIENNISIHVHWSHRVVIKNNLYKHDAKGFENLNQIEKLTLIGMDPSFAYGDTMVFYGYVHKQNGKVLAVQLMITHQSGKYELIGAYG